MTSLVTYRRKLALVIGIDNYSIDPLKYCVNDATDLKTTLQRMDFTVSFGENFDLEEFYRSIDTFAQTIQRDDLVLFYFAGHGKQNENDNYLLPVDYLFDHRGYERDFIGNHAVNVKYIMQKIDKGKCRFTIYLFDCCRTMIKTRSMNINQGLLPMHAPLQTLIVYTCAPGLAVQDETRNNRNGSFIENLLKHIASPNKDIEEIMKDVATAVHVQTDGFQLPYRTSSLTNKVILMTNNTNRLIEEKTEYVSSLSYARKYLTDDYVETLVKCSIIKHNCKELHLEMNKISSAGASMLASLLHENNALESLWLYHNPIGDDGIQCLARTLSINNNVLKELDLGKNEITDTGAQHLAKMICVNTTITGLYLYENRISDVGIRVLTNAMQHHNSSIKTFDLTLNPLITDECIGYLLEMIKRNKSLLCLSVSECSLTNAGKARLQMATQQRNQFTLFT